MKPKRIFQVYQQEGITHSGPLAGSNGGILFSSKPFPGSKELPRWRWRCLSARNRQIVAGSQEAFDTKGNAIRAAKREASLYLEGIALVEVAE